MSDHPLVSVIIATYNRAYILGECLESLVNQTAAPDTFEVIVVDNNSTDTTEDVVASFTGKILNLQFIKECHQGLSFARNAGMAAARGQWVACLDSDAKAHADWVAVIIREIDRGNFDCFGGPYLAWHRFGPAPRWFAPEWESTSADFSAYGLLADGAYPSGGTCAFSKQRAQKLGGFPTDIGMKGERCAYGEETRLFKGMLETGARIGCVPDMLIDHCVLPYKYRLYWRLTSAYAQGRDAPRSFNFPVTVRTLARECWYLFKAILGLPATAWRGWRSGHAWQRVVLDGASPVLLRLGSVVTLLRALPKGGC